MTSSPGTPFLRAVRWPLVLAGATLAALLSASGIRWLDRHVLGEALKDRWAQVRADEDWGRLSPLPPQRYEWLGPSARLPLVAHALGEAGHAI